MRAARLKKGLSPVQLANLLDMARTSVVNIEAGRQRVPIHVLWRLADSLEVSVVDLVPDVTPIEPASARLKKVMGQDSRLRGVSSDDRRRVRAFIASHLADKTDNDQEPN